MSRASRLLGATDVARVARAITSDGAVAKVQVAARGHVDEHQHWQPYGFQSAPLEGAHAIRLAPGSQRDDLLVIMVDDRRYRLALEAGEVALADDLGQKVHLTRTGIVVDAASIKLGAAATKAVALDGDIVQTTGPWDVWFQAVGTGSGAGAPPAKGLIARVVASATKVVAE